MILRDLDDQGQPLNRLYNRKRRCDRTLDELLGLSKGMAADGVIDLGEAEFLQQWLTRNCELNDTWPVNFIYNRLKEMLADGLLDAGEQKELFELLTEFTGQIELAEKLENMATTLPLDRPAPLIVFPGKAFCFTGKMVCGTRDECRSVVIEKGGEITKNPIRQTNYLVIGTLGSEDWAHTSYGRKIERAVELKQKGLDLHIVAEDHWAQHAF